MLSLKKYNVEPLLPSAAGDPQISPDGEKILFMRGITKVEEDGYEAHIWITPVKGGEPRQFTYSAGGESSPRWSHDGKTIFFLSNRIVGGTKEEDRRRKNRLWTIPAEGGEAKLLASAKYGISNPKLSPDGKKILFISKIEEEIESRPEEDKSDVLWITKLRYKLNGQPYFPYTRTHLFVVSTEGGEPKQLTKGPFDVSSPDWSPDGSEIVFAANPNESDYTRIRDIYIIPSEGGSPRKITEGKAIIGGVAWSPDGRLLAYTGRDPEDLKYIGYGSSDIWVLSLEGGKAKNLTASFDRTISGRGGGLKWSPDSKEIYFTAPDRGTSHIYKVGVDTSKVEQVTEGNITVSSFSLNRDASIIAFAATEAMWPGEVLIHDKEGSRRLTSLNADIMEHWKLVEPEEFWFTASDGVKVQGWILKPQDFKEGEKYPTILEIHGGPHAAYGYRPNQEFMILARHGYAVVYTNPRDSVGYGEEFAGMIEGDWGTRDFQDLMEAMDHVSEKYPFVDRERLGVAGGSFGGFMTNWTVTHTDRFKAAVTSRSVCNWYSQVGMSDVGWGRSGVGGGKDPWEVPEDYLKRSPITYIENLKTPLLIIHSENDLRCPIVEGEQLYVALKRMKKDVELIWFPNESHGLSGRGKPSHRIERYRHILRWFDKYLK